MRWPKAWTAIGATMAVLASATATAPLSWTTGAPKPTPVGPALLPAVSILLAEHPEFGSPIRTYSARVWPVLASQMVEMSDRHLLEFDVEGDAVRRVWRVPDDGMPRVIWESGL